MSFFSVINSLFLATLLIGSLNQAGCFTFRYTTFEKLDEADFIENGSDIAWGAIQVTPDSNGEPMANRSGRLLVRRPFRLWRSKGNNASFNTTFVLNIKDQTTPGGEGLAFILAGDFALPADSSGHWLGIVNSGSDGSARAEIVAIEFDTRKSFPQDIDDNHVGLDINSINSTSQFSLSSRGINISGGTNITVNVLYDSKNLSVFVGENKMNPVIFQTIDLSEYLPQKIFVGFSASTSNYIELNCVRSWEFRGSDMEDEKLIWVWIAVPLGLVLLSAIVLFMYWKRKCNKEDLEDPYPSIEEAIQGSSTAPQKFRFKELSKATGKFNPKNKLGKGGFGTVYKGILGNKEVAVKRVSNKSTQGKQEFIAEVTTIGNLHHRNLVKLIGWCYESREFLLVYEYMPNGSLDKYIFCAPNSGMQESTLSWEKRLSVITGVAQALDYLHNGCEKRVLHRDIKASNIMLDLEFNARLGDFGLARTIILSEQTHHSTRELAGTPGYMAPECFLTGRATVETDVYAFGTLVLEVACGRKPVGQTQQDDYNSNIVNWLWELYRKEKIVHGVDPKLNCEFEKENMEHVLILGLACCHPNPNKRPSMKIVLQVLTGEAPPPELPAERPAFTWPPLPPSFKDMELSLVGSQLNPFTELGGR